MNRTLYWLGAPLLATALVGLGWLALRPSDPVATVKAVAAIDPSQLARDAEFNAGVALLERRQYPQALAHFQGLLVRYPDLVEAHNNLAHVHAAMGDLPAARAALEAGVQAQPSVRTLVQNLRQLHARESLLSLNKALQVEQAPLSELTLARLDAIYVSQVAARDDKPAPAAETPPAVAASVPESRALSVEPSVAPAPVVAVPGPEVVVAVSASPPVVAAAKVVPADTEPDPAATPADEAMLAAQVRAWARAWSAPNVPQYLAFYDDSFLPPNGLSRRAWEAERRSRIAGRSISLRLENLTVTPQGSRAVVRFRQHYRSGSFVSSVNKRMVWVRRGAHWRIASEGVA